MWNIREKKSQKEKGMVGIRVTVWWWRRRAKNIWGKRLEKDGWRGIMRGEIGKKKWLMWHNERSTNLIAKPQLLYIVYR